MLKQLKMRNNKPHAFWYYKSQFFLQHYVLDGTKKTLTIKLVMINTFCFTIVSIHNINCD